MSTTMLSTTADAIKRFRSRIQRPIVGASNLFSLARAFGIAFIPFVLFALFPQSLLAASGILTIRNGYFWDPVAGEYFVPRGIAYQLWNPPVGANQSVSQVYYDLLEFKKLQIGR